MNMPRTPFHRSTTLAAMFALAGLAPASPASAQERRPPDFEPPGSTPNPGGGPAHPWHPPTSVPSVSPLEDETGNPPEILPPDFGDAPDGRAACGVNGGIGRFPTLANTTNAAFGRAGPRHVRPTVGESQNVRLGDQVSRENDPWVTACDWNDGVCDSDDDGALVLCLSPDCSSGIALGNGLCGPGINARFGPAPTPPYQGYWVLLTTRAESSTGGAFVNAIVDNDRSGVFGDEFTEWCLKDSLVASIPGRAQLFLTGPFPLTQVSASPNGDWTIEPFWSRVSVSDERVLFAFPFEDWDGSGTVVPYQIGETEDWSVELDPPQSACTAPLSCVTTSGFVSIVLNPIPAACAAATQITVTSAGRPPARLRELRTSPFINDHPVATQMLGLDAAGSSPAIGGGLVVRQRTDRPSFGANHELVSTNGVMTEAASFFEVFLEFQLAGGTILDTGPTPIHLEGGVIDTFPKYNRLYQTPASQPSVPLYFKGTTNQAGWICAAGLVFGAAPACGCPGDSNGDHSVNFSDITRILSNFGSLGATGDANADCVVNFADVTSVLSNFGNTCP